MNTKLLQDCGMNVEIGLRNSLGSETFYTRILKIFATSKECEEAISSFRKKDITNTFFNLQRLKECAETFGHIGMKKQVDQVLRSLEQKKNYEVETGLETLKENLDAMRPSIMDAIK